MRRAIGIAALVGLLVVPARVARADHTDQTDANDVDGVLDVEEVRFRHETGPYVWVFRTYAEWTAKRIWDKGFFVVQLDTIGTSDADHLVLLRSSGREMTGELFRIRKNGSLKLMRKLDGYRAGPQGAGVAVRRRHLTIGVYRTSFFWWTASLFTSDVCRTTCIDAVPDEGTVEQELPAQ